MADAPHLRLLLGARAQADGSAEPEARKEIDDLLMIAARDGERTAFAKLVAHYESHIRAFCGVMLRGEGQARDVAQDVFLRIWETRTRYRPQGRFREYVFTVARNLCRSKRRRSRLASLFGLSDGESRARLDSLPSAELGQQATHERDEAWRLLRVALSELDEQFRMPLVLRFFHDLSYDEIAAVIERTPSAARSRVFFGLRRLAELLPKEIAL